MTPRDTVRAATRAIRWPAWPQQMRNRFFVSLVFTLAILAWSDVGKSVFGSRLATPLGLDRNVWLLLLSLPVLWAARMFFTGAVTALRQRTLDMNVLVAVAIGVSWVYSVAVTVGLKGDVFFDAGAMLATFVLLGHWFEMRARGGASDSIRALLDLSPPRAVVLRDGEPVEVPTAEVEVGDVLLIRPGAKIPVDAEVDRGRERGRRIERHRGEPAGAQGRRRQARGRDDQQEQRPARPRCRRGLGHRAGPDRQAGAGGAELQGARPAAR